ncbi:MAG: hypothetical protein RIR70_974 [Pseudomonadota bacterium]
MNRSRFFIQSLGMGLVISAGQPVMAQPDVTLAQVSQAQGAAVLDSAERRAAREAQREQMRERRRAMEERRADRVRPADVGQSAEERRQFRQEMRRARETVYGPPKHRDGQ